MLKAATGAVIRVLVSVAKGHSYLWRTPGRRDEERKRFAALMRKVEAIRLCYGMTKTELAAELGANVDGLRAWMTGRTIGRKETVSKIIDFLNRKSVRSDQAIHCNYVAANRSVI